MPLILSHAPNDLPSNRFGITFEGSKCPTMRENRAPLSLVQNSNLMRRGHLSSRRGIGRFSAARPPGELNRSLREEGKKHAAREDAGNKSSRKRRNRPPFDSSAMRPTLAPVRGEPQERG